ncbi:MAG: hypothetical protein AB8I08_05885 [Sandaracinaceae bacterium]
MSASDESRAHILVLDDDELWLRSCVRRIRQRGGRVTTFTMPEDALKALAEQRFALGMIDYHLGRGWTGARFAEQARGLDVSCPPLILVSSALEQVPMVERARFRGAYPKATPSMTLFDEVFATIAEASRRSPKSHRQLRAAEGPVGRKRYNTPK